MGAIHYVLLGALALLLVVAAIGDWRHRIIENWLNLAIMAGAPAWWWATGLPLWPDVATHVAIALCALAIFSIFFALGAMGGGDVKLIAALALWFPLIAFVNMLIAMAVLGGVLTIFMMMRQFVLKISGRPEIPYGIAISVAGLLSILRTIS